MSKTEYRKQAREYRKLRALLKFCYTIPDRDIRVRAVGNIQTKLADMRGE